MAAPPGLGLHFRIQVSEGLRDDVGVFDTGNDSRCSGADRAGLDVDTETRLRRCAKVIAARVIRASAIGGCQTGESCGSSARLWPVPAVAKID